jgi:hypothetical protein
MLQKQQEAASSILAQGGGHDGDAIWLGCGTAACHLHDGGTMMAA